MKTNNGFTLIELMIVIAIIGILIGTTFKLMQVAVESKARAVTVARMERLQNALSGYFSAYGMYPAVPTAYINTDPTGTGSGDLYDESTGDRLKDGTDGEKARRASASAHAQPIGFEYPTPLYLTTEKLQRLLRDSSVVSMGDIWSSMDDVEDWKKNKTFKFGLLSFLLPRVEVIGISYTRSGTPITGINSTAPVPEAYILEQWKGNNKSSSVSGNSPNADKDRADRLYKQLEVENEVCRRWMPCFEGVLRSFADNILGVKVNCNDNAGTRIHKRHFGKDGTYVALAYITIVDGWGNEFFYYSAPPYQSFRVWSAGPDGKTFPPWIPSSNSTYRDWNAQNWIKDDIVGGKMQM
jgi:prepilin-type N-terminal cleavage/methylation domain-containing protein